MAYAFNMNQMTTWLNIYMCKTTAEQKYVHSGREMCVQCEKDSCSCEPTISLFDLFSSP